MLPGPHQHPWIGSAFRMILDVSRSLYNDEILFKCLTNVLGAIYLRKCKTHPESPEPRSSNDRLWMLEIGGVPACSAVILTQASLLLLVGAPEGAAADLKT